MANPALARAKIATSSIFFIKSNSSVSIPTLCSNFVWPLPGAWPACDVPKCTPYAEPPQTQEFHSVTTIRLLSVGYERVEKYGILRDTFGRSDYWVKSLICDGKSHTDLHKK